MFNNYRIQLKFSLKKKKGIVKVRRGLKKTFGEVTEIDSIVVSSSSEDLRKDLPRRYYHFISLASRSCGRVSSERAAVVDCEDRNTSATRLGEPEPFPLVPACASDRSQSSDAISREAIWHGVLAGCDLWRGSAEERSRMDSRDPKRPVALRTK